MIFQPVNPFPTPDYLGEEVIYIGIMFGHLAILFLLIGLMIYFYMKIKEILPILITYLLSLVIGIVCITGQYIPFTPYFQIFFLSIQTSFCIMSALDFYEKKNK